MNCFLPKLKLKPKNNQQPPEDETKSISNKIKLAKFGNNISYLTKLDQVKYNSKKEIFNATLDLNFDQLLESLNSIINEFYNYSSSEDAQNAEVAQNADNNEKVKFNFTFVDNYLKKYNDILELQKFYNSKVKKLDNFEFLKDYKKNISIHLPSLKKLLSLFFIDNVKFQLTIFNLFD